MFFRHKFISIVTVLVITSVSLSACVEPIAQATQTPHPSQTPTLLAIETPDFSGITDAKLESDRLDAFKATKTLISSLPNASDKEITEALLGKWLEYYKTDSAIPYMRLKDYKIEKVTANGGCPPPDKETTKSLALVEFSVQPVYAHGTDWNAGTGESTPGDSWIYHKSGYASVSASKGFYILGFEGIPPCTG